MKIPFNFQPDNILLRYAIQNDSSTNSFAETVQQKEI